MEPGNEIDVTLRDEIDAHDRVVAVLSHWSMKRRWVRRELNYAFKKEDRTRRRVVVPIAHDRSATAGHVDSLAKRLRDFRNIGDFTDWQLKDNYALAFERLSGAIHRQSAEGVDSTTTVEFERIRVEE